MNMKRKRNNAKEVTYADLKKSNGNKELSMKRPVWLMYGYLTYEGKMYQAFEHIIISVECVGKAINLIETELGHTMKECTLTGCKVDKNQASDNIVSTPFVYEDMLDWQAELKKIFAARDMDEPIDGKVH